MKVKDLIKLIPNGTILFIQTDVWHPDADKPFYETCEDTFTVGSCGRIPSAELEVRLIGSLQPMQMHIITENMYV